MIEIKFQFPTVAVALAFLAVNQGNAPGTPAVVTPTPTAAPTPPAVAPTPAPSVVAPAPAVVGAIDPFGDPVAPVVAGPTPMGITQCSDALKALCGQGDVTANRTKLAAYLKMKGSGSVGMLLAGMTDEQRGVVYQEVVRALA